MTIDMENLSDGWKKVIDQIEQEEQDSIVQPDETTIATLQKITKKSFGSIFKTLEKLVTDGKAIKRKAKVNGHWTHIYKLISP